MIHISDAAPIRGDVKFLGGGNGVLSSTPGPQWFAVGSFDLPAMSLFYKVLVLIQVGKGPLSASYITIGTSETPNVLTGASPGYIKTLSDFAWTQSNVLRSYSSGINYYNVLGSGSIVYSTNNAIWGDISAGKTIYVNMLSATDVDMYFNWAVYLIGDDVK